MDPSEAFQALARAQCCEPGRILLQNNLHPSSQMYCSLDVIQTEG